MKIIIHARKLILPIITSGGYNKIMRDDKACQQDIEKIHCLLCGGSSFQIVFKAFDFDTGQMSFQLSRCTSCNLVRTEPVLNDGGLEKYYSLSYYGNGEKKFVGVAEILTYLFNYTRAHIILSYLRYHRKHVTNTSPRILDIGCGRGNLLKIMEQKGCDCYGIERAEFPTNELSHKIHIYRGNLEDTSFEENFFDAVIIWHVLEHINNPILMIQKTARILRTGGIQVIAVPNFGSFQARAFRKYWFHLDLPRHVHHFTADVLLRLLKQNGFEIIHKHTFSIEQNIFGFIQTFFNIILPLAKPNQFYSLLKKRDNNFLNFSFFLYAILSVFVFPFALLEYLISGITGRGGTFIVYAKKC